MILNIYFCQVLIHLSLSKVINVVLKSKMCYYFKTLFFIN